MLRPPYASGRFFRPLNTPLIILCTLLAASCSPSEAPSSQHRERTYRVETIEVETRDMTIALQSVGTVYAGAMADIRPQVDGLLMATDFTEGDPVEKDQILAVLDDSKPKARLALSEARLDSARARLAAATNKLTRARRLLADELVSREQFETLEAEQLEAQANVRENEASVRLSARELEDYYLRAPFAGLAGAKQVDVGNYIQLGTIVTTVVQSDPIEVQFPVPSREVDGLKLGALLDLTNAEGHTLASGKLTFIDPRVDPDTRMVLLKGLVPNSDAALRSGQFVEVALTREVRTGLVVIPEEAVVPFAGKRWVFVVEDDHAMRREIVLGARRPGVVVVESGLESGAVIVVNGQHRLSDGAPVAATPLKAG